MCFFKKKKNKEEVAVQDKVDVQAVYARAKQIAAMADADSDIQKRIEKIADELKYFAPTSKETALKTDKKISNAVDDLRALVAGKKNDAKILEQIGEIDALIVYRKASLETEI